MLLLNYTIKPQSKDYQDSEQHDFSALTSSINFLPDNELLPILKTDESELIMILKTLTNTRFNCIYLHNSVILRQNELT